MPKYRLLYFNMKGRAEPIRWVLAIAEQHYEDVRLDRERQWPAKKKEVQYGKVPLLYVDDKSLSQSVTICRYLGNQHGLAPRDPWLAAVADEVADAVHDLLPPAAKILYAKLAGNQAEAQKLAKEFNEVHLKATLATLESKLKDNEWYAGDKMSWADILVACYLSQLRLQNKEVFTDFPNVRNHFEKIEALPQIQKWLKDRPETPL